MKQVKKNDSMRRRLSRLTGCRTSDLRVKRPWRSRAALWKAMKRASKFICINWEIRLTLWIPWDMPLSKACNCKTPVVSPWRGSVDTMCAGRDTPPGGRTLGWLDSPDPVETSLHLPRKDPHSRGHRTRRSRYVPRNPQSHLRGLLRSRRAKNKLRTIAPTGCEPSKSGNQKEG